MLQVHDKELFHDDGTPRRKYEIEDTADPRIAFRASIAVAVTSSVIFLKNVLFGGVKAQSSDHLPAESSAPAAHRASDDDVTIAPVTPRHYQLEDEEEGKKPDEFEHEHAKFKLQYSSAIMDVGIFGKPLTLPKKANDNVPLYSAPAGTASQFPFFEPPLLLSGHANSGGGSSAHTSSGPPPGTVVGDNDDIDDPVRNANRRPYSTGVVSLGTLMMNSAILLTVTELMKKVIDPDGDQLRVADLTASSGKLKMNSDGVWVFTPDTNDTTDVTFTYKVTDGQAHVLQTAYLDLVQPDTIRGTEGDDEIIGTPHDDVIDALGGNDVIVGREGNDVIFGGDGNDRILSGDGDDVIYAGAGNDFVLAGAGDDTVYGGAGDDVIFGEDGRDTIFGGDGNDWIDGGAGNDVLWGGAGNDRINGGIGDDIVDDGEGDDHVDLDEGNDIYVASAGNDAADGGIGVNTYNASAVGSSTSVNLLNNTATGTDIGTDTLKNFQNVVTGSGNDTVTGNAQSNLISTGAGNDLVDDGEGDDHVELGQGNDTAAASEGDDEIDGGEGSDTFDAGQSNTSTHVNLKLGIAEGDDTGTDLLTSIENVVTGSGSDDVTGNDEDNVVDTGRSDDIVELGKGNDTYVGHDDDGNDHVDGGTGTGDTLDYSAITTGAIFDLDQGTVTTSTSSGETATDLITGFENAKGGSCDDTFIASEDVNEFCGGGGDDLFVFVSADRIGSGRGKRDKILDFDVGDRIDFDDIAEEIRETTGEDFRFVLLSGGAQFARPGELRLDYEDFEESRVVVLDGNLDWDNNAEFQLEFTGDLETLDKLLADIFGRDASN